MPFLQAGFNYRHRETGIRAWTRPLKPSRPFAPAELIRFVPSGELGWLHLADRPLFLAWGDYCVFGTWPEIDLPEYVSYWALPRCDVDSRAVYLPETGWREAA